MPEFFIKIYIHYKRKVVLKKYRGSNVTCPVCGSSFNEFAPFGVANRKNAMCLTCGALERHRLLYLYLHRNSTLFTQKDNVRLLHFAPEEFFYKKLSDCKSIEYVPCDLNPDSYRYNGNVPIEKIDITQIPFSENYFDIILCNHVLEHIPDDRAAMRELHRVMKGDGWGIFLVPLSKNPTTYEDFSITKPEDRERAFGQSDHVRIYGRDYLDRLKSIGFDASEIDYISHLPPEDVKLHGLRSGGTIILCKKINRP